jgi:hypothetical protein
LGGELVGLVDAQRPYDHVLVAVDEETLVDVGGARSKEAAPAGSRRSAGPSAASHRWLELRQRTLPGVIVEILARRHVRSPMTVLKEARVDWVIFRSFTPPLRRTLWRGRLAARGAAER